ncbi:MAG: plasmid pRiA4b ORF-3 family protein [Chloroflexi bacterium]|nr:plasmid pRiA4b ORF-3 family protein [Chloroflexota bacterium]
MPETMPERTTVHHLKVSLDGIYPTIWRRLAVPSTTTLADLHMILQIALGWEGYHLHEFHVLFDARFGMGNLVQGQAAERATLQEIAGWEGARLRYVYDLGDYWEHTIFVERIGRLAPKPNTNYPRCLAGARAVPPEDCGGPENYMAMLRRRQSRLSRQIRQTRLAGQTGQSGKSSTTGTSRRTAPNTARNASFDPTAFDRDEINQQLSNWQRSATESAAESDDL